MSKLSQKLESARFLSSWLFQLSLVLLTSCEVKHTTQQNIASGSKTTLDSTKNTNPSDKEIINFSFTSKSNPSLYKDIHATVEGTEIFASVNYTTDLSNLVPTFQTSAKTLHVWNQLQVSTKTANDFRVPVYYLATAEDRTTTTYKVTVAKSYFDPSFGIDGIKVISNVIQDPGLEGAELIDSSYSVVSLEDNKILIGGVSQKNTTPKMTIWRLNEDGSMDSSFNGSGKVTSPSDFESDAKSIRVNSHKQILVAGSTKSHPTRMSIWRYSNTGHSDLSFGDSGLVFYDYPLSSAAEAMVISSADKIFVTGTIDSGKDWDMALWAYNSDGKLDTRFGTKGLVTYDGGNGHDFGNAIALDKNGKILVAGNVGTGNRYFDQDMALWRYNTDGTPDRSFAKKGVTTHNNAGGGNRFDGGYGVTTDKNNKILVTGYSFDGGVYVVVIWRYNQNGTLDKTFGNGGIVTHKNAAKGNHYNWSKAIVIDQKGRILLAGQGKRSYPNWDMILLRFNSDGSLDHSFGNDGVISHNSAAGGNGNDYGLGVALDASQRILISGYSFNSKGGYNTTLWRVLNH